MRVTVMQTDPAKQPWAFEADRITYTEHADGSLAIQVYAADGEPNGGAILPPGSWTGPIHEQP